MTSRALESAISTGVTVADTGNGALCKGSVGVAPSSIGDSPAETYARGREAPGRKDQTYRATFR